MKGQLLRLALHLAGFRRLGGQISPPLELRSDLIRYGLVIVVVVEVPGAGAGTTTVDGVVGTG